MKCPKCGANLSIDDAKCSFCGNDNPFAVKHRKEMHHFKKEFEQTKEEVLHKSNYFNRWTVKITLIAVLAALDLGLLLCARNMYSIDQFFQERKINAKIDDYREQLDEMLERGDYLAFSTLWEDKSLYYCDNLNEYDLVAYAAREYETMYNYTMDIVVKEETDYFSHQTYMEYTAESINSIYRHLEDAKNDEYGWYLPETEVYLEKMTEKMEDFVQTYYGLTNEEKENFQELSKTQRLLLMEEGIKQYE